MNIIIDSNVLFSALIKDSKTRRTILEYDNCFLFPSFIFTETQRHKGELLAKSKMTKEEFDRLFQLILKKVIIVPNEALTSQKRAALEIVKDIDINDALFVACALAYPDSVIWSDDKKLKNQTKVKVLDTREIVEFLKEYN